MSNIDALGDELRKFAETVLERVEPALRSVGSGAGRADHSGCGWCPMCAAVALVRGEHHDIIEMLAGHGTGVVTVLREAIAGVPVEPVLPADEPAPQPPKDPQKFVTIPVTIKTEAGVFAGTGGPQPAEPVGWAGTSHN